jgi:serine protease AprX
MSKITINGISIDPATQGEALAIASLKSADSSVSDYILIQTSGALDSKQKDQLSGLGFEILEYVPVGTYVCYYPPSDLDAIRALSYVEWANVHLKEFNVARQLLTPSGKAAVVDLLAFDGPETSMSQDPTSVEVVLHRNVTGDALREKVARAARLDPDELVTSRSKVRLRVHRSIWTTSRRSMRCATSSSTAHRNSTASPSRSWGADVAHPTGGFEGDGQIVAVCDTGFDRGSTSDVHPTFAGRVRKLYALGRPSSSDLHDHGTHVAGSVLGDSSRYLFQSRTAQTSSTNQKCVTVSDSESISQSWPRRRQLTPLCATSCAYSLLT